MHVVSTEVVQLNLNTNLGKFLNLINDVYAGNLKAFSDAFSDTDASFYERLKKDIQRAKQGSLTVKKEDALKKYIFFLEYKQWEKNADTKFFKKLDLQLDTAVEALCKATGQ
ncbi:MULTISPECIES: hypothetical protein [Acinetobacter]|jgi:hypothetical protein|uniref:hypothetical protein n=1 Tax=Acinetobacter TaxID=469 RepID=UPI0009000505|nr:MULTISPECIES: hypothetical protein [Acinetobacter]MCO8079252.1 hypothetical protein [Acinetobacter lwoffii]OIU81047.1 hypothetical protein BFN00_13300 [Acinetobacter sp. AR2-3]